MKLFTVDLSHKKVRRSLGARFALSFCVLCSVSIAQESDWVAPRTAYGAPDMQGLWMNMSQTPLQRPLALGEKSTYSLDEAIELEAQAQERDRLRALPSDPDREPPPVNDIMEFASDLNFFPVLNHKIAEFGGEYRTSLIVEPSDGRLPYKEDAVDIFDQWRKAGFGNYDGPEIRPVSERCVLAGAAIPHMIPLQGLNIQIVQNEDYVMILTEYSNEARIIRLNSKYLEHDWDLWMGDSIGYWEDDTLVVHTRDFHPQHSMPFYWKSSDKLEMTERFTMLSDRKIAYQYTAVDPEIYSEPVTVEIPLDRMPEGERYYESACHEGNYAMENIMRGARVQDVRTDLGLD